VPWITACLLKAGRVYLDLWNINQIIPDGPDQCERIARMARMNRAQCFEVTFAESISRFSFSFFGEFQTTAG
jgi:hypothetical protein